MDYEKAYNKALERAKKWYNAPNADKIPTYANRIIVEIFPELKESEDERIRKALVRFHKSTIDVDGIKGEDIVAWLEKQGKSTTIDIDKMVLKYSQTREPCTNGLPVNCQIRAYRQGINDTLRLSLNLEKQGEQKNKINSCKITFEDVLALECAMKTIKITEGGNELYEKLAPLYNKIHNVYLLEKQGEQKPTLSDEDKMMLNELIIGFYGYRDQYPNFWKLRTDEIIEWLKKKKDERTTDNGRLPA